MRQFVFKKWICMCLFAILFAGSVSTVSAKEASGDHATGQTEVVYVPEKRPPIEELDKGEGHLSTSPSTGEASKTLTYLTFLVITSAITLMLIIYLKKGETDYEEN